ncbi:FAD-dependent oxidoreductase [Afifella sp. IM 167]|nr:FAD-dependent oxidoreductase [Afifella sp. IM 167]
MTLLQLSDISDRTEVRASVCVIGAGPAGALAAYRLARQGVSVLLLESGSLKAADSDETLNEVESSSGEYQGARLGRRRGLGGTSAEWGGRLIPLTPHDMSERAYIDGPAWPVSWARLQQFSEEICQLLDVAAPKDVAHDKTLKKHAFYDQDIVLRQPAIVPMRARNIFSALHRRVRRKENLRTVLDATVTGFVLDRERGVVNGVRARSRTGREMVVKADQFVLAAGALESTRLLLLLDRLADGRPFASCQALGRYFQDHLVVDLGQVIGGRPQLVQRLAGRPGMGGLSRALHLELSPEVQQAEKITSAYVSLHLDASGQAAVYDLRNLLRDLQQPGGRMRRSDAFLLSRSASLVARMGLWSLYPHRAFLPEGVKLKAQLRIEQRPSAARRISLSSAHDRLGVPRIRLAWGADAHDARALEKARTRFLSAWDRSGLGKSCLIAWESYGTDAPNALGNLARDVYHPSGTTRMGVNGHNSVVDSDLFCHHVPNLSVLSASVFPTAGSANPTLTLLQLCAHASDAIGRRATSA